MRKPLLTMLALAAALAAAGAQAADTCKNRGDLDERYCDENRDLVADTPKDPKQWKDPPFLLFTYSPLEDPAVYEKLLEPYVDHLKAVSYTHLTLPTSDLV